MNIIDSRLYRAGELLTNLFLLNLLWLVACLPLVTVFPATAAMFGVVRGWIRGTDDGLLEPFLRHFRANFAQSLWIGVVWVLAGVLLIADYLVASSAEGWIKVTLYLLVVAATVVYILTSIYMFPVMVHYDCRWWVVLKNSLLIAISQLGTTVLCILVVGLIVVVAIYIPLILVLAGSVMAYVVYSLCHRAFTRIEELKAVGQGTTGSPPQDC